MKPISILQSNQTIPLMDQPIKAGFPNAAEDIGWQGLDLNAFVASNAASTFLMKVSGDSMEGLGIFEQDIVVVDKALTPGPGDVVVAYIDGEFTLKQFYVSDGRVELRAANPNYAILRPEDVDEFRIWGVVTYALHHMRGRTLKARTVVYRSKA